MSFPEALLCFQPGRLFSWDLRGSREYLFGESFGTFLIIVADLPWRDNGE